LGVSLYIGATGSHVPYKSLIRLRAAYMPDAARAVFRTAPELVPRENHTPSFDIVYGISTRHQRFAFARLSGPYLTGCCPAFCCNAAESARGVSPRAAHRSGLDTLASSGSCHRTKAAASRRELELLLLPVGSLPTSVTCPLRSTGITPLPRYYGAVRPCPPHRYFRPRSFAACTFSLGIAGQVLKFRTRARTRVMPPIHRAPRGQ